MFTFLFRLIASVQLMFTGAHDSEKPAATATVEPKDVDTYVPTNDGFGFTPEKGTTVVVRPNADMRVLSCFGGHGIIPASSLAEGQADEWLANGTCVLYVEPYEPTFDANGNQLS